MELFWHDVLNAARALIKHRGYSAFAILTLGLGIGVNVGMFNVFGWMLFPKLPVPRSFELVEIDRRSTSTQPSGRGLSWPMYLEYVNAQPNALPELAAYYPFLAAEIGNGNQTVSATVTAVTGNYFGQLQVHAFRGRVINAQDDSPNGGGDVAVLSYRCWRELFGGKDEALGTEFRRSGTTYTIIGVAPPTFTGIDPENPPDMWIPLSRASLTNPLLHTILSDVTTSSFRVFGRMKQGASVYQAREQMKAVAGQLGSGKSQMIGSRNIGKRTAPNYWEKPWPDIQLIDGHRQEEAHKFSLVVFGIVGSILILVAGNVTTILLARTERQCREFAIRIALGASRWRVARGILMESFMVSALGTVVGLIFAFLFIRLIVGLTSEDTRWHETIATGVFDGRVLAFGFGIAALMAGGFSLAPMVRAGSSNPRLAMQMTASGGTGGRISTTFRNLLTVFQTATSVVLLAFTLLLLQSAWNRSGTVFNFDTQSVSEIYWKLSDVPSGSDAERSFQNAFVERLKNLPGIQAAALCSPCKLGTSFDGPPGWYDSIAITPEYLRVANTPILHGRNFTNQDGKGSPLVGIVNLKMARQVWPREDPIGQRLEHSRWDDSTVEIVGVVADTRKEGGGEPENPILYRPLNQADTAMTRTYPIIRTDSRSLNLSAVRTAAREINPNVVISKMQTVADYLAENTRVLRLGALVLVAFAMIAVTLTVVGLYGLLSYIASAQTRDLGVRLALGAPRTSVLLLMLKRGVVPALVGVTVGLIAEAACPNIFSGALYGVGMHDIPTLVFVALTMFCVAVAASWAPSWRASRFNPIEALRQE
ncbi:MAG TPA: ADOP family duplicated permease [Candidatus Angelobacter sp.]|nr:ADOP family duplicated permease [Candidatus Angelobacter sp.]